VAAVQKEKEAISKELEQVKSSYSGLEKQIQELKAENAKLQGASSSQSNDLQKQIDSLTSSLKEKGEDSSIHVQLERLY